MIASLPLSRTKSPEKEITCPANKGGSLELDFSNENYLYKCLLKCNAQKLVLIKKTS